MMKQVRMHQGSEQLMGWIETRGAREGAMVEVKDREGLWLVTEVFDHEMPDDEVKAMSDRARQPFTALKSYRGNK